MIENAVFKSSLTKCFRNGVVPSKILIALSGGVDSVCMTYLLSKYRDLYQPDLQIHSVTIDHGYRQGSAEEAKSVGELVSKWGVDHNVIPLDYKNRSVHSITNFEEVARTMRYEAFRNLGEDLSVNHLFVAHNYNDQLETCMQRIRQKSTIFGLKGLKYSSLIPIPPTAPFYYRRPIQIIRPLLDFPKSQIIKTCVDNNVNWFEDYTNKDIHLTNRNLLRYMLNEYIPEKLEQDPNSELKCISEESISDTLTRAEQLTKYIQGQVDFTRKHLIASQDMQLNHKSGSVDLTLSKEFFRDNSELVIARFFFEIMFPISAANNYFWSFTKVLNLMVPRLLEVSQLSDETLHRMTYLKVLLQVKPSEHHVTIKMTRQPVPKLDIKDVIQKVTATQEFSDWILFDGRFWIRMKANKDTQVTIIPYYPVIHSPLLSSQYKTQQVPRYRGMSTPFLISGTGSVSLPTMGFHDPDLQVEWRLKDNAFAVR